MAMFMLKVVGEAMSELVVNQWVAGLLPFMFPPLKELVVELILDSGWVV